MAPRQSPETNPVMDNSALAADPNLEKSRVIKELDGRDFLSVIRMVKTTPVEEIAQIRSAVIKRVQQLDLETDIKLYWSRTPRGSDQFDPSSIIKWVEKINPEDAEAISQLLQLEATIREKIQYEARKAEKAKAATSNAENGGGLDNVIN